MGFLDRCLASVLGAASVLVLPLSFLLFLQWPLRELAGAASREANDLAQALFALFVSVAVTAATRERTHLCADLVARRYSPIWRDRLSRAACLLVLVPSAAFVVWTGAPAAWASVVQLERFPDTFNPGYFVVRAAALLLVALVLLQALVELFAPRRP